MANSSMLVFPISTASAALSRDTAVASYTETKFSSIFEPQVVLSPVTHRTSLTATTMPASAPPFPSASLRSTDRACSIA